MYPMIIMTIENDSDREFMERLYRNYYALMKKKTYDITKDNDVVEDIINDAIIKLFEKIETLKKLECHKLTSYIVYTIRSVAINFIIKRDISNKNMFYGFEEDLSDVIGYAGTANPEISFINNESIDELGRIIATLSETDQDLLFYKYNLEMNDKEIAAIFNISYDNVRKKLQRARQRALKEIKREDYKVD